MTAATVAAESIETTLLFAADSASELAEILTQPDAAVLAASGTAGQRGAVRLGIVGPTTKNLALARRVVAKGRPWRGRNDVWFSPRPLLADAAAGVAFLFPGLEGEFAPNVDDVAAGLGVPAPAVDVSSIGSHAAGALRIGQLLHEALTRMGIEPDVVAGHSVGEWSAMSAGGMFSSTELDHMIARCDLDAMAVPDVDFGVVGCSATRLAQTLATHPGVVVSHENSTNQSVVCGPADAVGAVLDTLRADGVVCQVLPFRSGFHTPMLRPHISFFEEGLVNLPLRAPRVPVWSTTIAAPFPDDEDEVRDLCVRHLLEPVRFRATVSGLYAAGARVFVQVGSGQLASLVSDTLREDEHLTIAANSAHRSGLQQLQRVATALWVEGRRPRSVIDAGLLDAAVPARSAAAAPQHAPAAAPQTTPEPAPTSAASRELDALLAELGDLAKLATTLFAGSGPEREPDRVLHVSTATMPYLLDHCFVPQRSDWPDEVDRRPVVPATTVVQHLLAAARERNGDIPPIGLDDLRLHRWLVASPAVDVPIALDPAGPGRLRVSLGPYAAADVVFDEVHAQPPVAWSPEAGEHSPRLSATELYEQRWLFHGERFQVVHRTLAVGPRTARAELSVTAVPGALLDGVGHVLGQWLIEQHDERWLAFPVRVDRLRFHGELPPAGTRVQCTVRVTTVDDATVVAEAQITHLGRVLVSIAGWTDHFFACAAEDNPTYRFPEKLPFAVRDGSAESAGSAGSAPSGRWVVHDRWPDLGSRELWMHRYLTGAEVEAYRRRPPREQRPWLLSRIAVKDAVRGAMWDAGAGPIFPAELTVQDLDAGWYTVTGTHGLDVPHVAVAVECTRDTATAQLFDGATARVRNPRRDAALTGTVTPEPKELIP